MTEKKRLSRRERQLLDALYPLGRATAAQLRAALSDPPSYTAIRTHLTNLERKGAVRASSDGVRYVYEPTDPKDEAGSERLHQVVQVFFEGRLDLVVNDLLSRRSIPADEGELSAIAKMIEEARSEGK